MSGMESGTSERSGAPTAVSATRPSVSLGQSRGGQRPHEQSQRRRVGARHGCPFLHRHRAVGEQVGPGRAAPDVDPALG